VHRFIYFRVSDEATARDLTQDTFVRALRKIDSLSQPERFEAWLMRIAHRAVQNHYRSRGRRPEQVEIESVEHAQTRDRALGVGASADAHDPYARLETALRLDTLREALAGLSDAQREVLGLRFVAGLSFAETAEATGKSLHAVRKLQYRGLSLLRQRAAEEAEEGSP
jgi:RNA polymerase sigma-70 factor (ECF subfamily)